MIKMEKSHVPVAASTHAGMSGKNNEDNYRVTAYQMSEHNQARVLLAVLCDGVGGHQAGEVASTIGVNLITDTIAESNGEDFTNVLVNAIELASIEVNKQAVLNNDGPGRAGMGSTASIACLMGNRLYTATVGDSRIYLIRDHKIQQISKDHTWIQDALDVGLITPAQVHGHPNAHVIRRYLGGPGVPEVDLRMFLTGMENDAQAEANQGTRLFSGDRILICSDGLSDLVDAPEILAVVEESGEQMQDALSELTQMANSRGGHDNITLILFRIPADIGLPKQDPPTETVEVQQPPTVQQKKKPGCMALLALPLVLAVVAFLMMT
ncbi:MAG: serine/threonine-protein phosphatase [Anaerolineae bacterium]|nr:serine/threonine-protein phosphatase [Anaerolineae bacterium]